MSEQRFVKITSNFCLLTFFSLRFSLNSLIYFYNNLGGSSQTLHHSVAQQLHLQKTDGFNSVINHSEPAIASLFLDFRLSVSVLPQYSAMIHNHGSVCLHQHPSLFMEVRSQGHGGEKSRERKRNSLPVRGREKATQHSISK